MEQIFGPNPDHAPNESLDRRWVYDDLEKTNGFVTVRHQVLAGTNLSQPEFPETWRMTVAEWKEHHSEYGLNEDGTEETS